MTDPQAEAIAKGLSEAQVRALEWSCADGKVHPLQIEGIDKLGLVTFKMETITPVHREGLYRPTPLGLRVRNILQGTDQ